MIDNVEPHVSDGLISNSKSTIATSKNALANGCHLMYAGETFEKTLGEQKFKEIAKTDLES